RGGTAEAVPYVRCGRAPVPAYVGPRFSGAERRGGALRDRRPRDEDARRDQTLRNHSDTCERSTLPPLRITPTRAPRIDVVPSIAAAAPSAPVGSTTSFIRSHRKNIVRRSVVSSTVAMSLTCWSTSGKVSE